MAEREPWELSNEESFSKGASGGDWAAAFVSATIAFLPASLGLDRSLLNCLSAWQANLAGTPAALP